MEKIEIIKNLLTQVYNLNPAGSLSNLRKIIGDFPSCESKILNNLAGHAHLASFNLFKDAQDHAARFFLESDNFTMLSEINKLIDFYHHSSTFISNSRNNIDQDFKYFCHQNGLFLLKTLQEGINSIRYCSWVYLVRDTDGIIKIFKEVLTQNHGPLAGIGIEDIIYSHLPNNDFLPNFFGTINISGTKFIKLSVHFGKCLDLSRSVSSNQAQSIILKISQGVQFLHSHDITYLDVKPENFLINSSSVLMLDLGISRFSSCQSDLDIYLSDPRFATPEGTTQLKATSASDVFQIGLLYYWLQTGRHPFDLVPFQAQDMSLDRESALLRYAFPVSVLDFRELPPVSHLHQFTLIEKMLDRDPSRRPDIDQIVSTLDSRINFFVQKPQIKSKRRQDNTILFPARMGIPHRGHIEFISRLLHLGYFVLISIQRTYTLTNRDPIQKSFVMKMVAQSLIDQGFTPDVDFSFISTPYYQTKSELECHFLSLPQIDDVIGVASSNPGIPALFPDLPIFDQNSVFGSEDQLWQDLSWGEIVRQSVRDNDYVTFSQYAASGVEEILSFDELRLMVQQAHIEFAKTVEVVCLQDHLEISRGRVFRYQFPEQSLVYHLKSLCGHIVKVDNLYSRDSEINLNGQPAILSYSKTDFNVASQHETIYFNLISEPSV